MKQFSFIQRFLIPLLLVGVLSILSTAVHMFTVDMEKIKANALTEASKLEHLLVMAESLVSERVRSSMQLLKKNSLALGTASINGNVILENQSLPQLMFGIHAQTLRTDLVDGVTDIGSGTATLFVKNGHGFIRVATNVRKKDGSRAVGTVLDPAGKVMPYLRAGLPFYGVVDILGEPYISGYDPINDKAGNLIGAWYVGYKVDAKALDQAIKKWTFLKSGFAAITDYNNNIRFLSERTPLAQASEILSTHNDKWVVVSKNIPRWDFQALIVYPMREAFWSSASNLYPLLLMGGVIRHCLTCSRVQKFTTFCVNTTWWRPANCQRFSTSHRTRRF